MSASKWDSRSGILARHAGHRCTVVDARSIRCLDCAHTLLLDVGREAVAAVPTIDTTPTTSTDEYGRQPCYRCSKLVKHLLIDGIREPLAHAVKNDPTGRPCTSPAAPLAALPVGGWRALVKQQGQDR